MGPSNSLYIVWLFAVCLSLAVNTSAFALRSIAANSTYASPPVGVGFRIPVNHRSRRPSILPVSPTPYAQRRRLLHDEDYTAPVYTHSTEPDGDYLYSDMESITTEVELIDTETPVFEDSTEPVYNYDSEPDAAFLDA